MVWAPSEGESDPGKPRNGLCPAAGFVPLGGRREATQGGTYLTAFIFLSRERAYRLTGKHSAKYRRATQL